jgi:serine/threonine protein phosphatase PrpC
MATAADSRTIGERPLSADIDVFGLTDRGKVRPRNDDHYLIASLHKMMQVHQTSLPPDQLHDITSESRGYLFIVADGVGGRPGGDRAAGTALQAIAQYATHTMRLYYHHDPAQESLFLSELQEGVERSHEVVRTQAAGTATTLTMVVVRWPRAYVVQVGDSRTYRLRDGRLEQLTKDQTMAQELVDAGILPEARAADSRWKHVLSSALGGQEATPVITTTDCRWDDVMLLCTDGLTKHVSDAEIEQQLKTVMSAEAICRNLVNLALERGGSDNVTVIAGRLKDRGS